MENKKIISICSIIAVLVIGVGVLYNAGTSPMNPLELAIARAENTINSKGFALGRTEDKILFEQANIGDDVYMAPIYTENSDKYTHYEYLLKNLEFEDMALWEYNYDHSPYFSGATELAYLETEINKSL